MSRGGNIPGVVHLQNQNYLGKESLKCSASWVAMMCEIHGPMPPAPPMIWCAITIIVTSLISDASMLAWNKCASEMLAYIVAQFNINSMMPCENIHYKIVFDTGPDNGLLHFGAN